MAEKRSRRRALTLVITATVFAGAAGEIVLAETVLGVACGDLLGRQELRVGFFVGALLLSVSTGYFFGACHVLVIFHTLMEKHLCLAL